MSEGVYIQMDNIGSDSLIENSYENRKLILEDRKCDKYDYLVAAACGMVGGIVDIFFVGTPKDSKLVRLTDGQVDNVVKKFAKLTGWSPKNGNENNVASAIGFLEKKFKVNYDQRSSVDVGNLFKMSTKNHHMMSLAHSPDLIGLFFSILNQFTSTSTFLANGQIITIKTDTFELQGGNLISKIFCGIANWFGHIMSDIAGSSGNRGNSGRGTGVVMPFYELFGFCKFGKFNVGKDKQDLATIATRAFQEGMDFRYGITMAIPVIITDLSIRLIWALRSHFSYNKSLTECIPTKEHSDLRMMLLFGDGMLCVMDGLDAAIRSGGNFLSFFMRLNLVAWFRLVAMVLKEICIRTGLELPLQKSLNAYKRINEALQSYLSELEKIDIEQFKVETQKYNNLIESFDKVDSNEELNSLLLRTLDQMNIKKPWQGDFDEHMSNKNGTLYFE